LSHTGPPFVPQHGDEEIVDDQHNAGQPGEGGQQVRGGSTYRNTEARPNTAIVGAERRLATEPVVIIARASQLMYFLFGDSAGPFASGTVVVTDGLVS
jgi:hypothetical protein